MSLLAATASPEANPVTLVTESVLALAAIASALTPVILGRRKARKEALDKAAASAVNSSDLTLAGWTSLNAALQQEINRLQGVTERMQARINDLEAEIDTLRNLALSLQRGTSGA